MNIWKFTTAVLSVTTGISTGAAFWFYYQRNYALNGTAYLFAKLAENDVELTEFDYIALKNASEKSPLRKKKTDND